MWGVFDFVCLDFFVAFFIPARAPSSLRSTSGASLAVSDSAENSNFRNRSAEDGRLFSLRDDDFYARESEYFSHRCLASALSLLRLRFCSALPPSCFYRRFY